MPAKLPLINAKAVKQFALDYAKAHKFHVFDRVSDGFMVNIHHAVKETIAKAVKSQPSMGKTLR